MDALPIDFGASPLLIAAVLAIVFAAAIVQAGLGMGFGLTAAPLLALVDPLLVPGPTLFLGLATATWGALSERGQIQWGEVGIGAAGRLAGVVLAAVVLAALADRQTFMLLFGITIASAVGLSLAGWRLGFTRARLAAMGVVSGAMGTITSVGAPPLALVYQDRAAAEARPTLAAFFAVGCAMSLAGLYLSGWAGSRDALLALAMTPAMLAGLFAARFLRGRFDRRYRPVMLGVSALAAGILIVRGLAG